MTADLMPCTRCHGSGQEPTARGLTDAQTEMLQRIREIGGEIALISYERNPEAFEKRRAHYEKLRALEEEWKQLGLSKPLVAGAAGLSRQGLHNILTHAGAV
jgi:hypothetical protein